MRRFFLQSGLLVLLLAFIAIPGASFADDPLSGILVPECDAVNRYAGTGSGQGDGSDFSGACQLCDLLHLAQNLINFAVAFTVVVATLMFTYAGILYFSAAAKPENIKKAHGIFVKVLAGLIIVLASWLIVDLIMKTLYNDRNFGPWSELKCATYPKSNSLSNSTTPGAQLSAGASSGSQSCENCENISSFSCKAGVNCAADAALVTKLSALRTQLGTLAGNVEVTEGWPPGSDAHVAGSSHNSGTAVDMAFKDGNYSAARVLEFLRASNRANVGAVFETNNQATYNALVQAIGNSSGINASQIQYNDDATANHFHVGP